MKLPTGTKKLGEATVYETPSSSRDGKVHYTFVFRDENGVKCTCEGWQWTGHCKHVDQVPINDH